MKRSSQINKIPFLLQLLFCLFVLTNCGRAYFPLELNLGSRNDRLKAQEKFDIELKPMTLNAIKEANKSEYVRRVVNSGSLNNPAKIIPVAEALKENIPLENDPGPYVIGVGDEILLSELFNRGNGVQDLVSRTLIVSDSGYISISQLGKLQAEGKTQSALEDSIYERALELGSANEYELNITGFHSKKIYIVGDNLSPKVLPYTNTKIYLQDIIAQTGYKKSPGREAKISLVRNGKEFVFSMLKLLDKSSKLFRLYPGDKINISPIVFRPEVVSVVGEVIGQRAVPISAFTRPTLSDTLFSNNILNSVTSDFSQIYVIRENKKKFTAFHLDITDPTRINLANKFEMRPDDVVFVATQPLSLYSRALSQMLGSTGLTLQARDTIRKESGN